MLPMSFAQAMGSRGRSSRLSTTQALSHSQSETASRQSRTEDLQTDPLPGQPMSGLASLARGKIIVAARGRSQ